MRENLLIWISMFRYKCRSKELLYHLRIEWISCVLREKLINWSRFDFLEKDIHLVEEENDGRIFEPY